MGSLNCGNCGLELLKDEDMNIYHPVRNEAHLAVKFERTEAVLNEYGTLKLYPIKSDSSEKFIKSADVKCSSCHTPVAFRIHCGPNRDSLLCISVKTTFNILADGSRLDSSCSGGGAKRKKMLEEHLEERDITEFYGTKMKEIKSDSLVGTLKHPSIDDLIGLELNSLVKDKPRSYQVECFCAAAMFSSIIQIPTGSGKTHISVMLTALYKRLNPNRMVWFLTDRIPLVFQQARYIEDQTSLTVIPLAGDVQTSLKPAQLIKYDVMVCTVQLLINMLVIGQIRIDDVSLVIIDEVHHAVKNHPYVVFIETFLSSRSGNDRPRLLGLTASPAAGNPIQMKLQLRDLSKLCGAQLFTPCIYRNDLASAVNRPKTKFIPVGLTSGDTALSQLLFDNVRELLVDESCPCSNLEDIRKNLHGLTVKSRQDHKLSAKLHKIHHFLTALEMTSVLGSKYSQSYLIDLLKDGGLEKTLTPLEEKVLKACREDQSTKSPKVEALCKIIESIDLITAPETRMIIFVETKRTARWLASFLQDHLNNAGITGWNPTAFTGQASNSVDGMNWIDEQRPILALFRSGHVKLLIATSVLQEGLDVAACNHIVLFDRTWSLKAFLQSRGRARAQDSEYTIICSADDESYYEKLFQQEIILSKMVRDEMVDGNVLCLELAMTAIHLYAKCRNLQFVTSKSSEADDGTGIFNAPLEDNRENDSDLDEEAGAEYSLTLSLHNVQTETFDGPCQLSLTEIERKKNHLPYFSEQEELATTIELPAIVLKSIRRSWIQNAEELLDPLIKERFPDALIELDRIIPELLTGVSDVPLLNPIVMELQKFAVGALDSGNKFIETAAQHHSYTPTMSQLIFEPLSRKIQIIFQESLEKTFRIEISFARIDSFCLLARNEIDEDANFSLILPLKTPPLLFTTSEDVSKFEIEKKIDEIYWERVTANSFSTRLNEVFSICPAIKFDLFLNGMTSRKLFQVLRKIGANILYTCNLEVDSFPEYHALWIMKTEKYLNTLDFETQYRLRAVISETWSKTSLRLTSEWLEMASTANQATLDLFVKKLAANRLIDPVECLKSCEAFNLPEKQLAENVHGSLLVKLVTWTPSRIIHHLPTLFLSNRVLREFGPHNFIRVHFRDEDFFKLSTIRSNASIDNLLKVGVKGVLDDGIVIGNRKFEFLAMSSSQLRGHGCWFVDSQVGADKIRNWLGKFDDIRNIAKYVARLGQSFSASRPTLSVPTFDYVSDWENNGFTFSDGCGMISPQLAEEIAGKLNLQEVPSAFQIRFAGFKGVVAVNPEVSGLSLRPSMKKFETNHRGLDVLNIAEAFPCYLNRQIIMILSALGVPDSAFEKLQMSHLKYLAECFNSNGTLSLKEFNISDLDPKDPFMRTLISAQYSQQLTDLLTKTRIAVLKGRILMGVVDESGILAEDEVFCQIRDEHLNQVIEGSVMIAKNPCMHPGDVRVLKAIRSPVLESYSHNVIVFSRHGSRPIPDMCSGSDLDGDLYFVTWENSLIPPQVDEPMNYEGLPAKVKDRPITSEDLKEFMIFFIENDKLGAIANTHVAFADQLEAGVRDPACMALARLFSLAVDFPKTGFVASIPKEVRIEKYPDFMQKLDKPNYASHRIIGTLFREIKAVINEEVSEDFSGNVLINNNFLTPGYEAYLKDARKLYEEYSMDVAQCLTQYGFRMESHLLMTCTSAVDISIREMNSDALEVAQLIFRHHVKRYQELFESLSGGNEEVAKKLASAWYFVTYSDPIKPVGLDAPILSFSWIIKNRPVYPRNSNVSLQNLVAEDLKKWFGDEANVLIDLLSQKLSLLNQLDGFLDDSSELQICLREFLLTGSIVLSYSSDNLKVKILKAFPAAIVKSSESQTFVTIGSTTLTFVTGPIQRSRVFSSQAAYIKAYLFSKISGYGIEEYFEDISEKFNCPLNDIEDLVSIDEVPKALRSWHNWILSADESVYSFISSGLLEAMDKMISEGSECKISILKLYYALLRTCRINAMLSIVNNVSGKSLKSSVVRTIAKNPRILRQIGSGNTLGPTGRGCYVQGASKMIFIGSSGEGDLLKFEIYDGRRHISHLPKVCYKLSLRSPQLLADDAFAYNEFWTHLHRQFHYLRRFGGPEYGQLRVGVKLGQIYALELPRMFMEQPVSIWLTRVALEKAFKTSKLGRKKQKEISGNDENTSEKLGIEEIDLSQLKFNPRQDACIDESISSKRVTQSLQSLIENMEKESETSAETASEESQEKHQPTAKKSSKAFGKMSTAFEAVVEEEIAMKFLKMGQFTKENNLNVSLTCYDEGSNTNTSLNLGYDDDNQLKNIGQRGLRWAVADVLSPTDLSARITITSANSRSENLDSSIFANDSVIEIDENGQMRVKEAFRSNQTIYARLQEGYSAVLRDDFTLIVRKISEALGVDPATGYFAITQEKWEVEAKMVLDWDEIHDYQYRDQLILTLWSISRKLKRPF